MTDSPSLEEAIAQRGITRVCHFTPSRNLPRILKDGSIRPTRDLEEDVRACYAETDLLRLDGHKEMVCCTIEYPNVYYLDRARHDPGAVNFPDWAILLIDPAVLMRKGALYCTGNAARHRAATARAGSGGFLAAYAASVVGSNDYTFHRRSTHLASCPTDLQAEVLLPGPISVAHLLSVVVANEDQALRESARLAQLEVPKVGFDWVIAPVLFQRDNLREMIWRGERPQEVTWTPRSEA
jgi:hypothetical protein